MKLRSLQGDTLDLILFRHYGYTAGITEQVLNLNPVWQHSAPSCQPAPSSTCQRPPLRPNSR